MRKPIADDSELFLILLALQELVMNLRVVQGHAEVRAHTGEKVLIGRVQRTQSIVRPGKFLFRMTPTSGFVRLRGRISAHALRKTALDSPTLFKKIACHHNINGLA